MKTIYFYLILIFIFLTSCSEDLIDGNARATLTGSVRIETTNEPLENVKISTTPASITVFTDDKGNFEILDNLPLGNFSVRAEIKGYVTEYQSISITEFGQEVHIVFEMITDESLNSPPTTPKLIAPRNLETGLDNMVELEWESSDPDEDEINYKVILTNNTTNNRIEIPDLATSKVLVENLHFGTTYTWQVIASDNINTEVFSEAFQFTIRQNPEYRYHYVKKQMGNYQIFSTNLEESIVITTINSSSWRPKKNNIASRLAFLQTYNSQTHLYTSNLTGGDLKKISQIPINGFRSEQMSFSWKADGSQLIFPSFDKLYKVNNDGTGQSQIYQTTDGQFISKCVWSQDNSRIAVTTNSIDGYQAKIILLDGSGNYIQTIFQNQQGAVGGLDFDITASKLLFTYDVSGNQDWQYRQLDTRIYLYDLNSNSYSDLSTLSNKPIGTLDIDPIFSSDNSEIIFTNTSNDMISQQNIYKIDLNNNYKRELLISDAEMMDYK